jgi:hypothetical protein
MTNHVWWKVPCSQLESDARWQFWHVVGKPAATWFGFVVCWYCVLWQE